MTEVTPSIIIRIIWVWTSWNDPVNTNSFPSPYKERLKWLTKEIKLWHSLNFNKLKIVVRIICFPNIVQLS